MINKLKEKILSGELINFEEAKLLSRSVDKEQLYKAADDIRLHFCGNKMELCSITNAKSGNCPQDCKWCSQSIHNDSEIEVYAMIDKGKAVQQAKYNADKGVNRMSLVTAGRKANRGQLNNLIEIYKAIQENTGLNLCASMGLLTKDQLKKLKDNGVSTYHCNLESSPSYFPKVCTTHTMSEKIQTIRWAQEVGLDICSGGIIGMGETMHDRIEMAFILQEMEIKSIPVNMLSPVAGTPLGYHKPLTEEEVLTTFAIFRFINPRASIRFAAGRILIKEFQHKALRAGVNSAIVGDLLTTIGTSVDEDKVIFKDAGFEFISND